MLAEPCLGCLAFQTEGPAKAKVTGKGVCGVSRRKTAGQMVGQVRQARGGLRSVPASQSSSSTVKDGSDRGFQKS